MKCRSLYNVDLSEFAKNDTIDEDEVIREITEGQGFDVMSGLFTDEDIQHARDTVHYLIGLQGSKATHFQVKAYLN